MKIRYAGISTDEQNLDLQMDALEQVIKELSRHTDIRTSMGYVQPGESLREAVENVSLSFTEFSNKKEEKKLMSVLENIRKSLRLLEPTRGF